METNVQTIDRQPAPDYKHLIFTLNPETGYYEMTIGSLGFNKVPKELKIEETQDKVKIKSDFIIRGRIQNGKYLFFTGILKTNFENWFFGDHFEIRNGIKRNSFILFRFSQDQTWFEMFFWNHYKLYPDKRGHFIREFITSLK